MFEKKILCYYLNPSFLWQQPFCRAQLQIQLPVTKRASNPGISATTAAKPESQTGHPGKTAADKVLRVRIIFSSAARPATIIIPAAVAMQRCTLQAQHRRHRADAAPPVAHIPGIIAEVLLNETP